MVCITNEMDDNVMVRVFLTVIEVDNMKRVLPHKFNTGLTTMDISMRTNQFPQKNYVLISNIFRQFNIIR